jgi:hypothetical protein
MRTGLLPYKNPESKAKCLAVYEAALARWPVLYEQLDVPTCFGSTHVIVRGADQATPLMRWSSYE